jgi:hypothetical protein
MLRYPQVLQGIIGQLEALRLITQGLARSGSMLSLLVYLRTIVLGDAPDTR